MKRYKHSLSHYKLLTFDMGTLIPCGTVEVLPGDTFRHSSSALIRLSPLVNPVMHPVQVRIHHWFVPNRIVWDSWEAFITGGEDGLNTDTIPVKTEAAGMGSKTVLDYMGVPTGVANTSVNALPDRDWETNQ